MNVSSGSSRGTFSPWRITLRRLLLFVTLLAVVLAWWSRPSSIRKILMEIHRAEYPEQGFTPASDLTPLSPLLERMPRSRGKDLDELLKTLSVDGFGQVVRFYGVQGLVVENEQAVPGATVFPYGYFCFAESEDGSRFAYCVHDRAVYQLGYITDGEYGAALTTKQIGENAWQRWESLERFLNWTLQRVNRSDWR